MKPVHCVLLKSLVEKAFNINGYVFCLLQIGTLSDRELRRISYQIADGNWKHLPNDLNMKKRHEINQIVNSNYKDQEKIYLLLVAWRAQMENASREELLRHLIDRLSGKRKDLMKFLKDMNTVAGRQNNNKDSPASIKTRFQKFTRSVRR